MHLLFLKKRIWNRDKILRKYDKKLYKRYEFYFFVFVK